MVRQIKLASGQYDQRHPICTRHIDIQFQRIAGSCNSLIENFDAIGLYDHLAIATTLGSQIDSNRCQQSIEFFIVRVSQLAGRLSTNAVAESDRLVVRATNLKLATSDTCLLYTSPSPRDGLLSRMPSSA